MQKSFSHWKLFPQLLGKSGHGGRQHRYTVADLIPRHVFEAKSISKQPANTPRLEQIMGRCANTNYGARINCQRHSEGQTDRQTDRWAGGQTNRAGNHERQIHTLSSECVLHLLHRGGSQRKSRRRRRRDNLYRWRRKGEQRGVLKWDNAIRSSQLTLHSFKLICWAMLKQTLKIKAHLVGDASMHNFLVFTSSNKTTR